jgi:hypothetical protein
MLRLLLSMAQVKLSDVGFWGPTLTCRYVQLKSAFEC